MAVHRFQRGDHRQHLEDGALAQVRLAGVRRPALGADAHLAAPPLPAAQGQVGGLGQEHDVGPQAVALDQRAQREPLGILLQGGAHDDHGQTVSRFSATSEVSTSKLRQDRRAVDDGRDAPLAVGRAEAEHRVAFDHRLQRRMRPLALVGHLVGVQVRVVKDDPRPAADAAQRIAGGILPHLVAADGAQLCERALDRRLLLSGVGADADQIGQETFARLGHLLRKDADTINELRLQ